MTANSEGRDGSALKIFISYRREDTQPVAGRLYDRLVDTFGEDYVLKDVDSIPYGVDFREYSTRMVKESDVVLVLIGTQWLHQRADGTRRIDEETDLVRLEVEAALQHCAVVIPILIGDAVPLKPSELPSSLSSLAFRNAARLRHDPDFRVDYQRLLQQLDRVSAPPADKVEPATVAAAAFRSPSTSRKLAPASSREKGAAGHPVQPYQIEIPSIAFCWCPAGTFRMGSPDSDRKAYDNEKPLAVVTLTEGFWLGSTVVTEEQWSTVMKDTLHDNVNGQRLGADFPVVNITWNDAMRFCDVLTERERKSGRLTTNWSITLPTEAQWEYACRAGSKTRFCFGDDKSLLHEYAWFDEKDSPHAQQAGKKSPNAWGFYDMHGNVWEWCRGGYFDTIVGGADPDPIIPINTMRGGRWGNTVRGGSWRAGARNARSAVRLDAFAGVRLPHVGFRIACVSCR